VTRPVEPDEDLAEESLGDRRLAAGPEDLGGRLGHRPRRVGGRERRRLAALGAGEEAALRTDLRFPTHRGLAGRCADAGPAHHAVFDAAASAHAPARRDELDDAARLLLGLGEPGRRETVAGTRAGESGGRECLRAARVDDEHGPTLATHEGLDRLERPAQGGRLPTPRRPDRRPRERVDREGRGGVPPECPRRCEVREREPLLARPERRLTQDEADVDLLAGARGNRRLFGEGVEDARTARAQHGRRSALAEGPQPVTDSRLDRAVTRGLESLDECADEPKAVLESEPGVPLAPLSGGWRTDLAAPDADRPYPSRKRVQPGRRQDGVEERETEACLHGCGAKVALDSLEDRGQGDELARRVEVEELVRQVVGALGHREPLSERAPDPRDAGG
jgi:hypothetical protein